MFFDDSLSNIRASEEVGMQAHHYTSFEDTRSTLSIVTGDVKL